MKKIFVLLGMLLLGIVSYAKEDDVLGTWLIKEKGKIVEIYKNEAGEYTGKIKKDNFIFLKQNNDLTYDKERNSLAYFTLKFPEVFLSKVQEIQRLESILQNYTLLDKNKKGVFIWSK